MVWCLVWFGLGFSLVWGLVGFYGISTIFGYLMPNSFLFQTVQFSISTQFSSIWSIDKTLSGATTPDLSGPGSKGNKGILCIPQSSSITGASPSDYLVPYPGYWLSESYPFVEMQSVYSIKTWLSQLANQSFRLFRWFSIISRTLVEGVIPLFQGCIWRILQPQTTGSKVNFVWGVNISDVYCNSFFNDINSDVFFDV